MTAQEALKAALRERIQPLLRSHGYKGSLPTWTRKNQAGDVAVVNVQSSSFSSAEEVLCVVNLAVAPKPWLDWSEVRFGKPVKAVKESDGLWRDRLHATDRRVSRGGEPWWGVRDTLTAGLAADDMAEQLQTTALPLLEGLLDRDQFIKTVRGGDLGFAKSSSLPTYFDWALLVLLADKAGSDDFEGLLARVEADDTALASEHVQRLIAWVRSRRPGRRTDSG